MCSKKDSSGEKVLLFEVRWLAAAFSKQAFSRLVVLGVILWLGVTAAQAAVPRLINYQGKLTDTSGKPVTDGNYAITFKLYTQPTAGSALWTEANPTVAISNGLFNAILGSGTVLNLDFSQGYYLGITVGTDTEMTPRQRLTSVGYAITADNLGGGVVNVDANGKVGIGTKTPDGNLTICKEFYDPMSGSYTETLSLLPGSTGMGNPASFVTSFPFVRFITPAQIPINGSGISDVSFTAKDGNLLGKLVVGDSGSIGGENGSVYFDGAETYSRLWWDAGKSAFRAGRGGYGTDLSVGTYSFASGCNTKATATCSTAMGSATTASGDYSTAMGWYTAATGDYSTAMGNFTKATATCSTAMGYSTTASGYSSTAMGRFAAASGECSIAMGYSTTASGNYSTAMGRSAAASGEYSTAMGNSTAASGNYSTAMGNSTKATATCSTAMGNSTAATGDYSTAMGYYTAASGFSSTAMGNFTDALGNSSTAMGYSTAASGNYSTAIGRAIEAAGDYSVAIALNNQNGAIVSQANTMAIVGGKVVIGTVTPTSILTIQQSSATDPIADAWTTYSSRRWKTNILPMENALDKVSRLRGVSFDWKEGGKHDIGLIAEEVGEVIPEVVSYEENGKDAAGLDYARLVAVLIEAIKEQQKQIEELKALLKK